MAESRDRLFTAVEMTFYDILAEWFTKPVPPTEPDPYIIQNWPPITRFFGEDTKWHSRIDPVLVPNLTGIGRTNEGKVTLLGEGFPGWTYEVWVSTDLERWERTGRVAAGDDGIVEYSESPVEAAGRFFRLGIPENKF